MRQPERWVRGMKRLRKGGRTEGGIPTTMDSLTLFSQGTPTVRPPITFLHQTLKTSTNTTVPLGAAC